MRTLAIAILLAAAQAAGPERRSDRDLKKLIDRLYDERDRFEDQLDGKVKRSTISGPNGDLIVERALDDLQTNVATFRDRFKPEYSAGSEAMTVFRHAAGIHQFLASQPPALKGQAEWQRVFTTLAAIAGAYGTVFPPAEGANARRFNDPEIKQAAAQIAEVSDRLKSALDTALKLDKSVDKATRETAIKTVESLKTASRTLASRVDDHQPASGDVQTLLKAVSAAETAAGRSSASAVTAALAGLRAPISIITQSFGIRPSGAD